MTVPLPDNFATGLVTGRFLIVTPDGADSDREPEGIPAGGVIQFVASVTHLQDPTADPAPTTMLTVPIEAILDDEGYLCTPDPLNAGMPGERGIRLPATDDPDIMVQDWTWQVVYSFGQAAGVVPKIPSHSMALPSGSAVDLTTVAPVPSSQGIGLIQAETNAALALAAAREAKESAEYASQAAQANDNGVSLLVSQGDLTTSAIRQLVREQLPVVNVMDYGAKGDGVTDDYAAIMAAIGDGGVHVTFPPGVFMHSQSITVPSHTEISGAGRSLTTIKLTADCPPESWGFVNRDRDEGNTNITIRDLRVDGNVPERFPDQLAQAGGGSRGSGITLGNVYRAWISRVDSVDNVLHGFDITCASVNYPYNGDMPLSDAPGPSRYVWIDSCYAAGFGDDGFTTHHSEYLWISNSFAEEPRNRDNCNGFEIDDGSRHVFLTNNTSSGCYGGIEIKAHADAPAGQDVHINGHSSLGDVRSYNWRHIGHHSGEDPVSLSAFDIQASNLLSINPNNSKGFQGETNPKALSLSAFRRVRIRGFTAIGDGSGAVSPVNIQYRASDVRITDMVLRDFGACDSGVYIAANAEGVSLDGVTIINAGLRAIRVAAAGPVSLRVSAARLIAPAGGGDYGLDAGYIEQPGNFSVSDDCYAEGFTVPFRVHGGDFISARAAGQSMWPSDPSLTTMESLVEAGDWYMRAGDFDAMTDKPADALYGPYVLSNRPDKSGSGVVQTISRWSTATQVVYTRVVAGSGVSTWAKYTTTQA